MARITQKEICVKYLYGKGIGNWVPAHDIVRHASASIGKDYLIQDADTRMYDIVRDGGQFESFNAIYEIEHRKLGKYAEFRIKSRRPKQTYYKNPQELTTV